MSHHVAVGALVGPLGVLMVHRRADRRYFPDCWDFPGGHIDAGETPVDALVRELREELGVAAVVEGEPYLHIEEGADTADGLVLDLWIVSRWSGVPQNLAIEEHDGMRWMQPGDLDGLRVAHPSCTQVLASLKRSAD